MNLPCSVVRDLLAQYEEGLTEEETRALVEEHLAGCEDCRRTRAALAAPAPAPAPENESDALKGVKRALLRRHWRVAGVAALAVLAIAMIVIFRGFREEWAPYSPEICSVSLAKVDFAGDTPGGQYLLITYDDRTTDLETTRLTDPTDGSETLYIQGVRNAFGVRLFRAEVDGVLTAEKNEDDGLTTLYVSPVPDRVIYGYDEGQVLLLGEPANGGAAILPYLALAYYALFALALALLFGLLWLFLRKTKAAGHMRRLFFVPLAYLAAHFLLLGLKTVSVSILTDLAGVIALGCVLYGLMILLWRMLPKRA